MDTCHSKAFAVEADRLTKVYGKGKISAVLNASFSVNKGEIFGLIGADGAGKTSIFRMLTTLLLPDGGSATVDGLDIIKDYKKIRSSIGYMPGKFSLYPDLTVEENLGFFATVFGTTVKENYSLIKDIYTQLEPFKKRRAGKLSGGMKQKLALCCALIHKPSVLFLDEPTTGVDPVSRREFWEMLKRLRQERITILVSTPYMDEATLCDRIALIKDGTILSIATPAEVIKSYPLDLFAIKTREAHSFLKVLKNFNSRTNVYPFGEHIHMATSADPLFPHSEITVDEVRAFMLNSGYGDVSVEKVAPTVEDCFIRLISDMNKP